MVSKPSVVYWNNIPSPYVVERFNAVADRNNVQLTALFQHDPQRGWEVDTSEWRFDAQYVGTGDFHRISKAIQSARPDVFVSLYHSLEFNLGSALAKSLGSRTSFRLLPSFESWIPKTRRNEILKDFTFRTIDAVKVPGTDGRERAMELGVPENRIFPVTQSIQIERYRQARAVTGELRADLRNALGLTGHVFLYVGRIWTKKGLSTLFEAFDAVQRQFSDVSLLIVGSGPDIAYYRECSRSLRHVAFVDFVQPSEIAQYYSLGDTFVFPTLGDPHGLVLDEALAAGLPVISSLAGGDIEERLGFGKAGITVRPGNVEDLTGAMLATSQDAGRYEQMRANTWGLVSGRGHQAYAQDFETFVEGVLSLPRRATTPARVFSVAGKTISTVF